MCVCARGFAFVGFFCLARHPSHTDSPRPGNVVLFHLPDGNPNPGVEMGLVITVWRGVKQPKINTRATPCASCRAFRVVSLDMDGDHVAARLHFLAHQHFWAGYKVATFF